MNGNHCIYFGADEEEYHEKDCPVEVEEARTLEEAALELRRLQRQLAVTGSTNWEKAQKLSNLLGNNV